MRVAARLHVDAHFHVLVELAKDGDKPVEREAVELHVADARQIGMGNAGRLLGGAGRPSAFVHHADDLGRKDGLGLQQIGVRMAEVAETLPLPRTSPGFSFFRIALCSRGTFNARRPPSLLSAGA